MTGGNNNSTREKLGAVFFAAVMVTSMMAVGMAGFAGGAAAQSGTATNDVVLGSYNQDIGTVDLAESSTGGEFGSSGSGEIATPDGVEFNTSNTNPSAVQADSGQISNAEFNADGDIVFDYSGLNTSEQTTLQFGQVALDVSPEAASPGGSGSGTITLDARVGIVDDPVDVDVTAYAPTETVSADSIAADSDGTGLTTFNIDAGSNLAGQIGADTNIVIKANQSNGVTFNPDSSLTFGDVGDTGSDNLNTSGVTLTETELVIPVTTEFNANDAFNVQGLEVDVAPDAEDSALTIETTPTDAMGTVSQLSGNQLNVQKPTLNVGSGDNVLAVGVNGQDLADRTATSAGTQTDTAVIRVVATADNQMAAGDNVTITMNNSAVTFDKSQTLNVIKANNSADSTTDLGQAYITDNKITYEIADSQEALDNNDELLIGSDATTGSAQSLDFNVSNTADHDTDVALSLTSGTNQEIKSSENNGYVLTLEKPGVANNQASDIRQDNLDSENVNVVGAANDALVITMANTDAASTQTQVGDGTNVTIDLESGTGVTFDTSVDVTKGTADDGDSTVGVDVQQNGGDAVDGGSDDVDSITITESQIDIGIVGNDLSDQNQIVVDQFFFNVTADAQDTAIDVTTNTTDYEVTTAADSEIAVTQDIADTIKADSDNSGSFDDTASDVEAGSTITGAVEVSNSTGTVYGGADVALEVTDADGNVQNDLVNTTSLTTDSSGQAEFNFTADATTGDYTVNATVDENTNVEITYTVTSSGISNIDVTGAENATLGGAANTDSNLKTGVYKVEVTDEFGNLIADGHDEDLEFRVFFDSDNAGSVWLANDINQDGLTDSEKAVTEGTTVTLNANGGSDMNSDQFSGGTFYVLTDNDGVNTEDVQIEVRPRGGSSDVERGFGTVTFYEQVDSVSLDAEQSLVVDDQVNATATAQTASGETITVPRLGESFSSDNSSTVSVVQTQDTDTNGEAIANLSADATGTANLTATLNGVQSDATEITVTTSDSGAGNLADYTNDNGVVDATGLQNAAADFRGNNVSSDVLLDAAAAFRSGDPVA